VGPAREVNFVIHCASAIRFDLPMRDTMVQVYSPTKALLEAAARMPALKAFCYMSSASANPNRPRNSTVEETIYPLGDPVSPTDGLALAESWLALSPEEANREASPSRRNTKPYMLNRRQDRTCQQWSRTLHDDGRAGPAYHEKNPYVYQEAGLALQRSKTLHA
jgi:Male sterility protein